jgi:hypothetical protein
MKALIISAIIISLILLMIFIPIRLCIRVLYNSDGFKLQYRIFFGFIRVKKSSNEEEEQELKSKKVKKKKEKKTAASTIRFVKSNITAIKKLIYDILGFMFKRGIKINKIDIKLILGSEDAMLTALAYGGVSAFVYNAVAVMDRHMMLNKHKIELRPDFNNPHILTDDTAIISTNILNVTVLIFILLRGGIPLWRKYKKFCASETERTGNNG